jgi:hypothetical protein
VPIYHVTNPDGHVYEVNAPEGATEQDAIAYVQKQHALPQAAAPQPHDPTDGMSGVQKFAAGVGKSLVDTGQGLKQAGTDAARYFVESNPVLFGGSIGSDTPTAANLRAKVTQQTADADARKAQDAPLMSTGAGFAGDVTGQVAQLAIPVGDAAKGVTGARALTAGAAKNAAFAAVQPVGANESRLTNAGEAAALGAVGPWHCRPASRA